MLALWNKLNGTRPRILQSTYEPSLRGDWPRDEYTRLLDTQLQLAQALAQLGLSLTRLGPRWRRVLVRRTAFLNPNLISDVSSTFCLLSMALRDAHPLPEATPGPLVDRLLYHDRHLRGFSEEDHRQPTQGRGSSGGGRGGGTHLSSSSPSSSSSSSHDDGSGPGPEPGKSGNHHRTRAHVHMQVHGAQLGDFALTWSTLEDVHFGRYASAVLALSNILSSLDEAEDLVKALVGTIRLPGYRTHLMRHSAGGGGGSGGGGGARARARDRVGDERV
jgi:hypothetical protein